jgi:hypothetical protein
VDGKKEKPRKTDREVGEGKEERSKDDCVVVS